MKGHFKPHTKATKNKISKKLLGRKLSEATRRKMSKSHQGIVPVNVWKKGCPSPYTKGHPNEKNPNWKGDSASYSSIHKWVNRKLGRPQKCSKCGATGRIHWANKSHKYLRDLSDWIALCAKCHQPYDFSTWGEATIRFGLHKKCLERRGSR